MEDTVNPRWRKSSKSSGNGGACVEAGDLPGRILVRDTTNRDGGTLVFTPDEWTAFTASLKVLGPI